MTCNSSKFPRINEGSLAWTFTELINLHLILNYYKLVPVMEYRRGRGGISDC
jgi:hypothetical protein